MKNERAVIVGATLGIATLLASPATAVLLSGPVASLNETLARVIALAIVWGKLRNLHSRNLLLHAASSEAGHEVQIRSVGLAHPVSRNAVPAIRKSSRGSGHSLVLLQNIGLRLRRSPVCATRALCRIRAPSLVSPSVGRRHASGTRSRANAENTAFARDEQCALTLRSSGPPPGWHLAREASWFIIRLAGQAPTRWGPLSSNVRRRRTQ